MWWGWTPALNLHEKLPESRKVLTLCVRDIRHVLKSISKNYNAPDSHQEYYICEDNSLSLARSVLLASLWIDESLGLDLSSQIWLEIYGNLLLRPCTWRKFASLSNYLINVLSGNKNIPGLCLDWLKYKEKDQLVEYYTTWRSRRGPNVLDLWDSYVRRHLTSRYDTRNGVFDWDYHFRLREYTHVTTITCNEYTTFRNYGIAFMHDDADPCVPNLSLLPVTDLEIGPFFAFGTESRNVKLLEESHGRPKFSAGTVSEWNLRDLLYGLRFHKDLVEKEEHSWEEFVVKEKFNGQLRVEWPLSERSPLDMPYQPVQIAPNLLKWTPVLKNNSFSNLPIWLQQVNPDAIVTTLEVAVQPQFLDWIRACTCTPLSIIIEAPRVNPKFQKGDLDKIYLEIQKHLKTARGEPASEYDSNNNDYMYFIVK